MSARRRFGVVMDPIADIKFAKDSTLAMLLAAQAYGFELTYLEQADLSLRDGVAFGRARALTVRADPNDWFTLGEPQLLRLGDLDCLLMRKDPPFDTEYIYTTYVLERAEEQGALVVNRPQGLRDMNEKVYTAWFPQCCAPTLITRSMTDMEAFLREHGKIVVKPLDGMGGRSIFVLELQDKNMNVVFETLTDYGERFAIAQRYIPDIVETGDSRVLVIDGEPVSHALARIPPANDNRGNLAAGARHRPPAQRPGSMAGAADRSGPGCQGDAVCGTRRDRRVRHRDQRHQPHGHPRAGQTVRNEHRRPADSRDRKTPARSYGPPQTRQSRRCRRPGRLTEAWRGER